MSVIVTDLCGVAHDVEFTGNESGKVLYERVAEEIGLLPDRIDLQFSGELVPNDTSMVSSSVGINPGDELEICDKPIWPDAEVIKTLKDNAPLAISKSSLPHLSVYVLSLDWRERKQSYIPLIERGMVREMMLSSGNAAFLADEKVMKAAVKHVDPNHMISLFDDNTASYSMSLVTTVIETAAVSNVASVLRELPVGQQQDPDLINKCFERVAGTFYLQDLYCFLSDTVKRQRAKEFFNSAVEASVSHVVGELYRRSPTCVKEDPEIVKLVIENGSPAEMDRLVADIQKRTPLSDQLLRTAFDRCENEIVGDFVISNPNLPTEQIEKTFTRNPTCTWYVMDTLQSKNDPQSENISRIAKRYLDL
eukprot:TRINITY_DN34358_c0_g1_i1.p1 TRINITY_DN34358_c0_g1~~TRINITY_DN34358_c0_g1_i1.p1  ORF type:complete len:364 (+),score=54.09 TRINITY_DN34358_c0_g1_i1:37-1128(+)